MVREDVVREVRHLTRREFEDEEVASRTKRCLHRQPSPIRAPRDRLDRIDTGYADPFDRTRHGIHHGQGIALTNCHGHGEPVPGGVPGETGRKEAQALGRYIVGLGAISNASTLLGLLGTISGMIKIFQVISEQPIVNPPSLAGGISEALYTTAFGLLVAIPAFIAYKYTLGKADGLISDMEQEGRRIMEEIVLSVDRKEKAREMAR